MNTLAANEKYLYAEKSRSSIRISTMRIFDSYHALDKYVQELFQKVFTGAQKYWVNSAYVWVISDSKEPRLDKNVMRDLELRNEDSELHSWDQLRELGVI